MKVLVCPLNWGLGHATRCVPLIQKLAADGHEVVLASDGSPLVFLKLQFPSLRYIEFPSYSFRYSDGKSQILAMICSIPNILSGIFKEHLFLQKLLKTEHFDRVISDNRFGLWSKKTHSTYITHQLMIKMPRGLKCIEPVIWLLHRAFINNYDKCLIPDYEGKDNLSGDLAHKYPLPKNAKFIGPLSRFQEIKFVPNNEFEVIGLVSGPEPQRTIFENYLTERFMNEGRKALIICGQPQKEIIKREVGNLHFFSHSPDKELAEYLVGAEIIISRSGYSTIMDLNALKCLEKAEFIPTPGQTEQEYLCSLHAFKSKNQEPKIMSQEPRPIINIFKE